MELFFKKQIEGKWELLVLVLVLVGASTSSSRAQQIVFLEFRISHHGLTLDSKGLFILIPLI